MKIIIDIPEKTYRRIQALVRDDYFEHDICGNSMRRIADGIPLPKDATNGDVIKAMFPNCEVSEHKVKTNSQGEIVVGYDVFLYAYHPGKSDAGLGIGIRVFFDTMWWNAPYKAESEAQ